MKINEQQVAEFAELYDNFSQTSKTAAKEYTYSTAMPTFNGTISALMIHLFAELDADSHLVEFIPSLFKNRIDEINSQAVMDKLELGND